MFNADFYDQFTEFLSWYGMVWGRGITAPVDIANYIKLVYADLLTYLGMLVHPYFLAVFAFAIGIALIHKFFRMQSKE